MSLQDRSKAEIIAKLKTLEALYGVLKLRSEWRDISTAPKDGSNVLTCSPNGQRRIDWWDGDPSDGPYGWLGGATHWMHIPDPPAQENESLPAQKEGAENA